MSKIPTVEEFFEQHIQRGANNTHSNYLNTAIEFAKLHVEACKKQFKIVISEIDDTYPFERKDILKDIYPLENVK